ncbi:Cathepsin L1, partial [Sarracenia purpurea var. burkii]
AKYNKHYSRKAEEQYRKGIFERNFREVEEHNELYRKGLVTWAQGIYEFADLNDDELARFFGVERSPTETNEGQAPDHTGVWEAGDFTNPRTSAEYDGATTAEYYGATTAEYDGAGATTISRIETTTREDVEVADEITPTPETLVMKLLLRLENPAYNYPKEGDRTSVGGLSLRELLGVQGNQTSPLFFNFIVILRK